MEPLKDILTIYEDKEKILKYFLPPSSTKHLDEYEYDEVCIYVDKNVVLKFETYNDMFFLKICIELEKDLPYTYQDEIIKNISEILNLLDKLECN